MSAGRQSRHSAINDAILRACVRAGFPSRREPTGLLPDSSERPDGCTVVPWFMGRCVAWDVTVPDTLARSHLHATSTKAGAAAEKAEILKQKKYGGLLRTHAFSVVAVETLGPIGEDAVDFLLDLGRKISRATGDPRESAFLFPRVSIAVQRGNSVSVLGTSRLPSAVMSNVPALAKTHSD